MIPYRPEPTLLKLHSSDKFVRGVVGPFGCVSGDTKIVTEFGLLAISQIDRPMRVLSWDEKLGQFRLSLSGGAFPKGKDYLYRVTTQRGEFVASGHHRVLCGTGRYERVDTLSQGQSVFLCLLDPHPTSIASSLKSLLKDARRYSQTVVDYLGDYARSARQYGQRLLSEIDSVLVSSPLQVGALQQSGYVCEQTDDLGQTPSHTHQGLCFDHAGSRGFYSPIGLHEEVLEDRASSLFSEHNEALSRSFLKSQLQTKHRQQAQKPYDDSHSYSWTATERSIVSIERLPVQQVYWDMQVADTNNYVSEDGGIHHNSGKSVGCCWEIFFKCKTQTKAKDGFRHSRWVVVRNTKDQLRDTALRTWLDWFPDGTVGHWKVSDMTYYLEYDDIKAEILFRALDTPDDVKKLLSLELTGAWVNEARELPLAIIDGLTGRVGRFPKKEAEGCRWAGIIMDTNPPDDDHWWFRRFEIQAKNDPQVAELYEVFHQPPAVFKEGGKWIENPKAENISHLRKGYYTNMVVGKDEEWIKVYAQGLYGIVSDGKPVYKGYNDAIHCVEFDVNPRLPVHVGWDYSFNGQACVLAQLSPAGQLRIFKEFVGEEIGLHSFVVNVVKPGLQEFGKLEFRSSTGDPAGAKHGDLDEKFALGMLNDAYPDMLCGLPFSTFPADTNSLGPRIDGVNSFLNRLIDGAPALLIHPRCSTLRKGFLGRYEFKRVQVVNEDRYKDVPNKNKFSHPHDALQYVCRGILADSKAPEEEFEIDIPKASYSGY